MITFERITTSKDLPPDWDNLCTSYFQTREFLGHCQNYNPCRQRYYLFFDSTRLTAGAIVYTLRLNLLTFLKIPSPVTMQICGVPCSVSSSGLIGDKQFIMQLTQKIIAAENGLLVFLNTDSRIQSTDLAQGRTWPTIILKHSFNNWDEYVDQLRSEYRRRIKQITKFCEKISFSATPLKNFSDTHYQYYYNVYRRSKGKLELLSKNFFKNLPQSFHLTDVYYQNSLVGWTIENYYLKKCSFFLGGQNYSIEPVSVYLAKLFQIVKTALNKGYQHIDLGQSAEIPKMRFGGIISEKYMAAHHSNRLSNWVLNSTSSLLSYNKTFIHPSVFTRKIQ